MKLDIQQLEFVDPLLRQITQQIETELCVEFTITSIYRIGDKGVHGTLPVRGIDWQCRNDSFGEFIESYINALYAYDYTRPEMKVCMYHDAGTGAHLHIQVHPNTRLR